LSGFYGTVSKLFPQLTRDIARSHTGKHLDISMAGHIQVERLSSHAPDRRVNPSAYVK